jgi:hypothetical protein
MKITIANEAFTLVPITEAPMALACGGTEALRCSLLAVSTARRARGATRG